MIRKWLTLLVLALILVPGTLLAQNETSNKSDKSYTIVEETVNDSVKIITTTVVEKEVFFTNGFWHNWEFVPSIGPHMYIGENDLKVKSWTELITFPAIDFHITKWASPSIGIGIGITTGRFYGLYQSNNEWSGGNWYVAHFKTDDFYYDADPKWDYMKLAKQKGWFTEYYALVHVDIRNVFSGYDPDRFYIPDFYVGGGLMVGYDEGGKIRTGAFNVGLINKFRITDLIRFEINLRGALVADDFDGELYVQEPSLSHRIQNIKMDGNIGITAGFSILLGRSKSKWNPARRTTEIVHLGDMGGRTDTIVITEVQIEKQVPELWFHINFQVDKWELRSKEKVNLNAIADIMKSLHDVKFLVCGYADMQTASPEQNLMLSEKRAHAVYDYLIDVCGVDPDVMVLDYKGGVDMMFFDEKELSRCVMITTIKE